MNHDDYEQLPTTSVATNMTAGAIAGVLEHCVMYPLDSVKTRMQSLSPLTHGQTITSTMMNMINKEGLMRPLRGVGAVVIGAGPAHAMYFSSYEFSKELLAKMSTNNHINYTCAAVVATVIHDAISNPTEVIKQRLQMYNSRYQSVIQCMKNVYKQEGLRAFYRSYNTQLVMNLPYQTIHFSTYEFMQNHLNKDRKYNPPVHMLAGAMAGATAAAVTTPLDVVKTLLNTQETGIGQIRGMWQAVRKIHETAGVRGFFKGMLPRVLYSMPATAICWSTYEFFKYIIETRGQEALLTSSRAELLLPPSPKDVFGIVPAVGAAPTTTTPQVVVESGSKPRELPAMSGAGMYGALQYNTVHHQQPAAVSATTMQMRGN